VVVALLALAWAPLTSHCQLESVPGLEFLRCSADVQMPTEGGDPCQEGGCCTVESATYQSPRQQEITLVVVAILPGDSFGFLEPPLSNEVNLGVLNTGPPGLPTSWQFFFRTALSPRAPSLAS
jgi:hypothetical protein